MYQLNEDVQRSRVRYQAKQLKELATEAPRVPDSPVPLQPCKKFNFFSWRHYYERIDLVSLQ